MAVRKNLAQSPIVRQRIRTSQLINRLQDHVLGRNKMTFSQVRGAVLMLRKTLPDLRSVALSMPDAREARDVTAGSSIGGDK